MRNRIISTFKDMNNEEHRNKIGVLGMFNIKIKKDRKLQQYGNHKYDVKKEKEEFW